MFKQIRNFFAKSFRSIWSSPSWVYRPLASPHGMLQVRSGANVTEDTAISWTAIWRGLQLVGAAIGSMPFTIQELDKNGNVLARAWCEAEVQRIPAYLDASDDAHLDQDSLTSPSNQKYGRRFVITQFRWLSSNQI